MSAANSKSIKASPYHGKSVLMLTPPMFSPSSAGTPVCSTVTDETPESGSFSIIIVFPSGNFLLLKSLLFSYVLLFNYVNL